MKRYELIVVTADKHMPMLDKRADKIVYQYIKDNKDMVKYYVDLGDFIDNPNMSVFPLDPEYHWTAQQEIDMYIKNLKKYSQLIPNAEFILIKGNHDYGRIENTKRMNRGIASLRALKLENLLKEAMNKYNVNIKKLHIEDRYILKKGKINPIIFIHGDPRLDPYIKSGVTGLRRTAEMYPLEGDIVIGHKHQIATYPRLLGETSIYSVGALMDIRKIAKQYISYHGYQNGFMVIAINPRTGESYFQQIPIIDGRAVINGKIYKG